VTQTVQGDQIPSTGRGISTLVLGGEGLPAGRSLLQDDDHPCSQLDHPVLNLTGASSIAFGTTNSPLRVAIPALSLLVHHTAKTRVNSNEAKLSKWKMISVEQEFLFKCFFFRNELYSGPCDCSLESALLLARILVSDPLDGM